MENPTFRNEWLNYISYKEFDLETIRAENAEIAQEIENKISVFRKAFADIFANVKHGNNLIYDNCPIYPAAVHAIKQELGYRFCEEHAAEVNALFDSLVEIARAQDNEQAKA